MFRFLIRRLGFLVLTMLLTSLIIFIITQYLPGDVARVILGREASETSVQALRAELGLNRPLPAQYVTWLGRFVSGGLGQSYSTELPVRPPTPQPPRHSLLRALPTLPI